MITENLSTLKIHKLSQEQYDREAAAGRLDETAIYLTPDDNEVDNLQEVLDSKADANHTHLISEVANLSTTLNEKATQIDLDTHAANNTHITSTERTNWNAAHTHSQTAHAPSNAEPNQNAFSFVTVDTMVSETLNANSTESGIGIVGGNGISTSMMNGVDNTVEVTITNTGVTSIKGDAESSYRTGDINITKANIGLGNVDNTSDINKPVSTAQQTAIDSTLASAKSYTDTKTTGLASTSSVDSKISTHNTSTSAHSDIRTLISDLSTKVNNFLDVDDTTTDELSEVLTLINNNKGTLESLTTSKVNVSDIVDDLTTSNSSKVLSAKQGVALKTLIDGLQEAVNGKAPSSHSHAISDVTNLQTTLDGKAPVSHKHDVTDINNLTATVTELNYMDGVTSGVQSQLNEKVPATRTINGKSLASNITLSASDVSAYTKSEIDNYVFITTDDIDAICGAMIQIASAEGVTF